MATAKAVALQCQEDGYIPKHITIGEYNAFSLMMDYVIGCE